MFDSSIDRDPKSPLISSRTFGWESIVVEEFQQPPGGIEEIAWAKHSIALCLANRPNRLYQKIGDRSYIGLYTKGDISITPAGIPYSYRSYGDDRYLHIEIPPQFLQQVAKETIQIDPDHLQLSTEFRIRHPHIEQICMMLRSSLHQEGNSVGKL